MSDQPSAPAAPTFAIRLEDRARRRRDPKPLTVEVQAPNAAAAVDEANRRVFGTTWWPTHVAPAPAPASLTDWLAVPNHV